jgi:Co/Zn/Cd efflux system component
MHLTDPSPWKHSHDFAVDFSIAEKNTRRVLMLTAAMMIAEIIFGLKFHSMALFADGSHMGTRRTFLNVSSGNRHLHLTLGAL